ALLERHAREVFERFGRPGRLVELGCGSGEKLELLLGGLDAGGARVAVHLVDLSPAALDLARRTLARRPGLAVVCHEASHEAAGRLTLVLFLGSNIGNFDPGEAGAFVAGVRRRLRAGDGLLLGVDLAKPERELILAYDDPLGVTAAFNKNHLLRMNRELGADF